MEQTAAYDGEEETRSKNQVTISARRRRGENRETTRSVRRWEKEVGSCAHPEPRSTATAAAARSLADIIPHHLEPALRPDYTKVGVNRGSPSSSQSIVASMLPGWEAGSVGLVDPGIQGSALPQLAGLLSGLSERSRGCWSRRGAPPPASAACLLPTTYGRRVHVRQLTCARPHPRQRYPPSS